MKGNADIPAARIYAVSKEINQLFLSSTRAQGLALSRGDALIEATPPDLSDAAKLDAGIAIGVVAILLAESLKVADGMLAGVPNNHPQRAVMVSRLASLKVRMQNLLA